MSEEAAFLRTICDNPDDDTARLVFADWLDEQDSEIETRWASLLREQLRPGSERLVVHFAYDEDWMETWGTRFEFPATMVFGKWKRGFPVRLDSSPARDLLPEWDRVLRLVPVSEVYLWQATDADVEELAASCDLRGLHELLVQSKLLQDGESLLTDRTLVALAECPALCELQHLIVRGIGLTDHGIDAALHSPHLAHLRELHVTPDRNFAATPGACERLRMRFGRNAIG